MSDAWDVAIVGGGPSGLSTALHLHLHAPHLRVIVLERSAYPRDKTCAGAIGARAISLLEEAGVDLHLGRDVPAVRIDAFTVSIGGRDVQVREPDAAWVVRRIDFDAALARAVASRGIAIRQGARVVGLDREEGTLQLEDGALRARVIVGADGVTGPMRRLLGLPRPTLVAQAIEVDTERVASDLPTDAIRFSFHPALRGYTWDFPTPVGGDVLMSRGVYLLRDDRAGHADVRAHLRSHLDRLGLDLRAPRRLAELGFSPRADVSRSRAILVGEAAGIDFPTGEGIAQAIAYGAVAGPYLARAFARSRFDLSDWRSSWLASREGRLLRVRHLGGRALFGRSRPLVERMLARSPTVFQIAAQRFAGHAIARGSLLRALRELTSASTRCG